MIPRKRGDFGDHENQRFHRNRGLFKAKVSKKGGIFLTWRTLMGLTNSLRVGVPGYQDDLLPGQGGLVRVGRGGRGERPSGVVVVTVQVVRCTTIRCSSGNCTGS